MKCLALATTIACGVAIAPAGAQNTLHAANDLVLTLQNPGGATGPTSTVIIALGNVSLLFRDAAPGAFISLGNFDSAFDTFGQNWFNESTLWVGAVGFRGSSDTTNTLLDGDPSRTIYATKARNSIGDVGFSNSAGITLGTGFATNTVNNINTVKTNLETIGSNTQAGVVPTSTSFVDDQNPFTIPGIQGPGYGNIPEGVQDNFGPGNLGLFGSVANVEVALDLFRLQYRNDIAGQAGFGQPTQIGSYEGTITIDSAGNVGFAAAVPEPSSAALLGLAALGLAARRRNRSTVVS